MSFFTEIFKIAPTIATAFEGPLAGAALSFLADKLGVSEPTQDKIQQILAGTDPVKIKQMDIEFKEFMAANNIKLDLAQIGVNTEEAKSTNWFVAGWRPAVGWVCVTILGLSYVPKAVALASFWCVQSYLTFFHPETKLPGLPPFPDIGLSDVLGILGTLLGSSYLAKLRTDEKKAGVDGVH